MSRQPACDHAVVYSGQTNLEGKFAYICRTCGECGWDTHYIMALVNFEEYYRLRVVHGWHQPPDFGRSLRLPAPPRVPTHIEPQQTSSAFLFPMIGFALLSLMCALSSIPWGKLGPVMPLPVAMMGSGLGLLTSTICYVCWKKGF